MTPIKEPGPKEGVAPPITVKQGDDGRKYKISVNQPMSAVVGLKATGFLPYTVYDAGNKLIAAESDWYASWEAAADAAVENGLGEWESPTKYRLILNDGVQIKVDK